MQHIAIKKEFQNQGFRAISIELIALLYKPEVIEVETDDDSLGFYLKAGFKAKEAQEQSFFSKRYVCHKTFKKT